MTTDETFRIPLDALRVKPPVSAGMSPYTLLGMVPLLRNSTRDYDPILVDDYCACCGSWRTQDGRHRFFAGVIAGRSDILALRDPNGDHPVVG